MECLNLRSHSYIRALWIAGASFLMNSVSYGAAGIELVPVAVWQGKLPRPWSLSILNDIREAHKQTKFAHAVNAASIIRGGASEVNFRDFIGLSLRPGDDVVLHFAPWKSLVESSGVTFKYEPTAFGAVIVPEDCNFDCGLEIGTRAFKGHEIKAMTEKSLSVLSTTGFGTPKTVYFDEGVVSQEVRTGAKSAGLKYDWSGIEIAQLNGSLGRFPVSQWNSEHVKEFSVAKTQIDYEHGLHLDHIRYSIHAEIGELATSKKIISEAIEVAKKDARIVRVPLVFNVEDLIHTREFVEESIRLVNKMALEALVPLTDFEVTNNTWDVNKIKMNHAMSVASLAPAIGVLSGGTTVVEPLPVVNPQLSTAAQVASQTPSQTKAQTTAQTTAQTIDQISAPSVPQPEVALSAPEPIQDEFTETVVLLPGEAVFVPDSETPAIMNIAH